MNEGHKKTVVTLVVLIVLAVVVGLLFYFSDNLGLSFKNNDSKPLKPDQIKQILDQNNTGTSTKPTLPPSQRNALNAKLDAANKLTKDSKPLDKASIQNILLQNK